MTKAAKTPVQRIISGGQTGVDRGALDAAIALGIGHGGWCPRGRRAEDGVIPDLYQLQEMKSDQYHQRTRQNVMDSDGTLILHVGEIRGGTRLTRRVAVEQNKPLMIVNLSQPQDDDAVAAWLTENNIRILNVAGPRESSALGIAQQTEQRLLQWIAR